MKTKSKTTEDIPGITTGNICGQQYDVAINRSYKFTQLRGSEHS